MKIKEFSLMWEQFTLSTYPELFYSTYACMVGPMVLTSKQREIMIGVILGDAHVIRRVKPTHNTRIRFDQAYPAHEEYLRHLYSIFSNLTKSEPKIITRKPDKRTGKIYESIRFTTRNLPCLNEFQDLFYPEGIKKIPGNISELLTEKGLAY